jgi:hypothetical protein
MEKRVNNSEETAIKHYETLENARISNTSFNTQSLLGCQSQTPYRSERRGLPLAHDLALCYNVSSFVTNHCEIRVKVWSMQC